MRKERKLKNGCQGEGSEYASEEEVKERRIKEKRRTNGMKEKWKEKR